MTSTGSIFASSATDVTIERVRQLVDQNLPEGLTLEYKESFSSGIVKSVAAMANSYGGIILVGVRDGAAADRLVGVSEETIVQIVNACHDAIEPPWEPEIVSVPLEQSGERSILVVRVDPARAPRPLLMNGSAPVRLQGRNAIAGRDRLEALFADASSFTAQTRQLLPQPVLPTQDDGSPDADFIFRSGFWLPLGEAASWRPLGDSGIDRLKDALQNSAIARMLSGWASQLGVRGLNPFDRRGANRAHRARLVWQAAEYGPVTHPIEAIAELVMAEPHGAAAPNLSVTVDVVVRAGAVVEAAGWPAGHSWRLPVPDLYATIDALLEGLTDEVVVQALADIGGVDPAIVPQPTSAHLITGPPVDQLLYPERLTAVPGAGASHGANLVADPTLDLGIWDERHALVDMWVQQIALDAGLRGMEQLIQALRQVGESAIS
jgi:hypothetical protein